MRLTVSVLLTLTALSWADTSYQSVQTYQDHQDLSNYYHHQPAAHRRTGNGLAGIIQRLFYPVRRQTLVAGAALPGGGAILVFAVGAAFVLVLVTAVGYYISTLNSSGRGLDTDEWEVDHSIWMDQLQKDFEDSWSN